MLTWRCAGHGELAVLIHEVFVEDWRRSVVESNPLRPNMATLRFCPSRFQPSGEGERRRRPRRSVGTGRFVPSGAFLYRAAQFSAAM
jgi:hypothetical protein